MTERDATRPVDREAAIERFIGTHADYYKRAFAAIGQSPGFVFSFNPAAALFGPVWFGGRRLWGAFWPFLIAELVALIVIVLALSGSLNADLVNRADWLDGLVASRQVEAAAALAADPDSAMTRSLTQSLASLERAAAEARLAAESSDGALPLLAFGIGLFVAVRALMAILANGLLERAFRKWCLHRTEAGFSALAALGALGIVALIVPMTLLHFSGHAAGVFINAVPAIPGLNSAASAWIDGLLADTSRTIGPAARAVTRSINTVLSLVEYALIQTPWPVVMAIILALAWQIAGFRVFLLTAVAISYLALLGFWEKSMQTVALLGTAAFISIAIGIPLGIACGYSKRLAALVRPVLDFMQTMPAFVYLIPVIALFGIGKPSGIIATVVFGIPPVVRLTALGIASVPANVREAATAFGATRTFLLFKIDLPIAAPSIMTGVSQTILMCLSMVVIAALIGAQGLGEDVLRSLQYAAQGQGLLAGFAILACAIVLDRVVQGRRRP